MQLLAPDILNEARELSMSLSVAGLLVGLFLWLQGGRNYRFWIVLVTTLLAGVFGLHSGPEYGVQPLVAGLLSAVAAGAMALALIRVVAFSAGGLAALMITRAAMPSWDDPLITFLAGGLVGLVLFRLWMMVLTSLAGTLIAAYSGLCLAAQFGKVDAVEWAEQQAIGLNWAIIGAALFGVLIQFFLERRRLLKVREREEKDKERALREAERRRAQPKKPWWAWNPFKQAA